MFVDGITGTSISCAVIPLVTGSSEGTELVGSGSDVGTASGAATGTASATSSVTASATACTGSNCEGRSAGGFGALVLIIASEFDMEAAKLSVMCASSD